MVTTLIEMLDKIKSLDKILLVNKIFEIMSS